MPGFDTGSVMYALNVDFTGNSLTSGTAQVTTNGQLLIGSTALPNIKVGTITSPLGTLSIGYSSPNITIDVAGGGTLLQTLSDDVGTVVTPTANNIQLVGHVNNQTGKFSTTVAGASLIKINPMSASRWIVDALGFNGTHTTIASAVSAASSGDTIIIMPGTYVENFTISKSLIFYAYSSQVRDTASDLNVAITGTVTISTASLRVSFSGITFNTNGAVSISVTAASQVFFENCYFNASNANSLSGTGNLANIYFENCSGTFASTFTLFTSTGSLIWIKNCLFLDTAGTLAASTISSNSINLYNSSFAFPFTTSSTGQLIAQYCRFGPITNVTNQTWITTAGNQTNYLTHCQISAGTSSAISIGAGTVVETYECIVNSTNTNAITGAGTSKQIGNVFPGSGQIDNTTTRTGVTSWTPVLDFGGGTTGITYSSQIGSYVRIGNIVFFNMQIILTSKGSSTGTASITGLPISSTQATIHVISASNLTFTGQVNARMGAGSTTLSLDSWATTGARVQLADTAFANTTIMQITGSYLASA